MRINDHDDLTDDAPTVVLERQRRRVSATTVAVIAITLGAGWAIYAERMTIRSGFGFLDHLTSIWVGAAAVAQTVSMTAFALLQKRLLRAVGARLTVSWLLSSAYLANAIAFAVPVAGSGMATRYAYKQFRRGGVDPAAATITLTLAGIVSTVAFAMVIVIAAVASGNPVAALGTVLGAVVAATVVVFVGISARLPQGRARLERLATWVMRLSRKTVHRPKADPHEVVRGALDRVNAVNLTPSTVVWSLT